MHVPYHSHQKTAGPRTGPSTERGAEIDLGTIPDRVHEVVACNFEKCNEARGVTDWRWLEVSRVSRRVPWTDAAASFRVSEPPEGSGICCSNRWTLLSVYFDTAPNRPAPDVSD